MSEASEQWAWAQPVDPAAKIVLFWMARFDTAPPGPAAIARLANMPHRTLAHAKDRLISGGYIKAKGRGQYVLLMGLQTPTSGSLDAHEGSETLTPTRGSPVTHPRASLARAADNNNNNNAGGQASLLTDPEWVTVIHGPDWVTKRLTQPQIATIDRTYGRLNLMIEATKWADHWTESRPSRRPKAVARSFINWCINEVKRNGTGSTTGISQGSSALHSGRPLSGPDRPRGEDIYIPGQT
tara:strand:- start:2448 stop:3167 length:720 start_codon:yes stop_codon:yes gene_type:complete